MAKRILSLALTVLMLVSALSGCAASPQGISDGRDRPSNAGRLCVTEGRLCSEDGEPVMLRGLSNNGVSGSERFVTQETFDDLSTVFGCNVFRMALYTYGMGVVGYCTGGNQEALRQTIYDAADYAAEADMYLIVDWHVLSEGDPARYAEDAVSFFDEVSSTLSGRENIIYEICNEPNGVTWQEVKDYAEKVIPVIRENDPEALILVGNPDWSKDLAAVAEDPLEYDNIMYTFHFYSQSHQQEYRDVVKTFSESGLPIFVSEFGITSSSGGFPRNIEEADLWIELLEQQGISYVMWNFSKSGEACALLRSDCMKSSGFDAETDLSETGLWFVNTLTQHSGE